MKEDITNRFFAVLERVPNHNEFDKADAMVMAIGDSYKRGWNLRRALRANGFDNLPESTIKQLQDVADDLVTMPTEYFEAKIQRAVGLGGFKGAIVPTDTPQETLDILRKHGITNIEFYDRADPKARSQAAGRLKDVLFSIGGIWIVWRYACGRSRYGRD